MLHKLLSHVDLSGEIMPRKLMELAPGTPSQWFIQLCAFLSKNTCLQNELCKPEREKIKLPSVSQTFSIPTAFVSKGSLGLYKLEKKKSSRTLTHIRICLSLEGISQVVLMFKLWPHPQIQGLWVGFLRKRIFFFLCLCWRISLVPVITRRANVLERSMALIFGPATPTHWWGDLEWIT